MKTIVVIEDDFLSLQVIGMALTAEGYEVFTAWNGRDGLSLMGEHPPDLVLSDWMMPILDGEKLYQAMQADPALASIPLVIMSGMAPISLAVDGRVAAVIDKPFRLVTLLETISRLIGGPHAASNSSPQDTSAG